MPSPQSPPAPPSRDRDRKPKSIKSNSVSSVLVNFNSINNKIDLVSNFIYSLTSNHNLDIIFGTETWLKEQTTNSELNLPDYEIYRRDRPDRTGGGVFICVKKSLSSSKIQQGKLSESVFVKIDSPGNAPIILCCAYRAPNNNYTECETLCTEILEVKNKFTNSIFWLAGDFNLPDISWPTSKILDSPSYGLSVNQKFLDTVCELGLTHTVTDATRGANTLDLFFTNHPSLVKSTEVISGISDHEAVTIKNNLSNPHRKRPKRRIYLWNKADPIKIRTEASKFAHNFLNNVDVDVDTMWTSISNNLLDIMKNCVPSKESSSRYFPPWITPRLKDISETNNFGIRGLKRRTISIPGRNIRNTNH